jgi:hypothetical protein
MNSSLSTFTIYSAFKFYESAFGSYINSLWDQTRNLSQNKQMLPIDSSVNPIFNNKWINSLFPAITLWPETSFSIADKEKELEIRHLYSKLNLNSNISLTDFKKEYYWNHNPITLGDQWNRFKNMDGISGAIVNTIPFGPYIAGTTVQAFSVGMSLWRQYFSIKSILSQFKSTKNHYKYFFNLKKMILYTKQLLSTLFALYKANNITEEYMIPQLLYIKNIFKNKKENSILNKILSWSNEKIHLWTRTLFNFFVPGSMAHFYFKDLYESIEIDILKNFIGSIDLLLSKINLLSLKEIYPEAVFSIPHLLDPSLGFKATFNAKNIWFPTLKGTPIKNSVSLQGEHRNMMLVSPVAGGKTVFLSTILTELYMANLGIVPAEILEFTFFVNIADHMKHDYILGDGMSQHLAERKSMHMVKKIAAEQKSNEKGIIIIDEIYKGTIPQLAVKEALIDLPPILEKENIITIITTHFPEITKITQIKNYCMNLYYLLVNHIAGMFQRTHKLYKDDEFNWWLRDEELGLKYQLAQDNENSNI